jgi:long-chain acyl-CoA synthetase
MFNDEINTKISVANGYRICEKIFRFALLPDSFTVGDELSAKQEMMRFRIREKYKDIIASLFEE